MKSLRWVVLGWLALGAAACSKPAKESKLDTYKQTPEEKELAEKKAKGGMGQAMQDVSAVLAKVTGTWELQEGNMGPKGSILVINPDGWTFTPKGSKPAKAFHAKFYREGNTLKLAWDEGDEQKTKNIQVIENTDKVFEIKDDGGNLNKFVKVPGSEKKPDKKPARRRGAGA